MGKSSAVEMAHCVQAYGYKGFKVTIPAELLDLVLLPEKWPAHVSIKRFYQPKGDRRENKPVQVPRARSQRLTRSASVGHVVG